MHVDQLRLSLIACIDLISIEDPTAHAPFGYTCSSVFAHAHDVAGGAAQRFSASALLILFRLKN